MVVLDLAGQVVFGDARPGAHLGVGQADPESDQRELVQGLVDPGPGRRNWLTEPQRAVRCVGGDPACLEHPARGQGGGAADARTAALRALEAQ